VLLRTHKIRPRNAEAGPLANEVDRLRNQAEPVDCHLELCDHRPTRLPALAITPVLQLTERIRYAHLPRVEESLFSCPAFTSSSNGALYRHAAGVSSDLAALEASRALCGRAHCNLCGLSAAKPTGPVLSTSPNHDAPASAVNKSMHYTISCPLSRYCTRVRMPQPWASRYSCAPEVSHTERLRLHNLFMPAPKASSPLPQSCPMGISEMPTQRSK